MQSYAINPDLKDISEDTNCGYISGFSFSNGSSSTTISNNGEYYIGDLPNNFYVDVLVNGFSESASIKVKNLSTGQFTKITENYLPYTFPSGNGAWNYGAGEYQVVSKIYKYNNLGGYKCHYKAIKFTITNSPSCGKIDGLVFSNGTNSVNITNGGSYDIDSLPYNFYVDVVVSGMTESAFNKITNLDTGEVFTNGENVLPYTYPSGNQAWTLGAGTFQFYSEIFKYDNCVGTRCDHICYTFTINEQNCSDIAEFQFTNGGADTITIEDGGDYDINSLPHGFYVDVIINGDSESVRIEVENLDTNEQYSIIENYIPYTFPAGNAPWDLGTGTFQINASLFSGNYCTNTLCDEQLITFTLSEADAVCIADSGTITLAQNQLVVDLNGPFTVDITLNGDAVIPAGSQTAFVLSQLNASNELVILDLTTTNNFFEFNGFNAIGSYRVHVLVYDPSSLDLNAIQIGQTTATDVENIIAGDNMAICASLEEVGIPFTIIAPLPKNAPTTEIKINGPLKEVEPVKNDIIESTVTKTEELSNVKNSIDVKLYPNPVANSLNVELLLLDAEVMNYNIIDLNGRQVHKGSFDNSTFGKTSVDVNGLTNGLYIVTFRSNFRTFSKKIQVKH